ncbi:SRPBCC family protein [Dyella silvatica]|uniref:SRPBCC family protein n=1 Tax=Dyella silvatica TaxID=2992128 RepID=UPI00225721AC|nr:SRPBCC domain-containing protein [Dyella silvatica]
MSQRFTEAVLIHAPAEVVWECLTGTEHMREWMGEAGMMIEVETDWQIGGPIIVRGRHSGRFENRGIVLAFEPQKTLAYTHLSSLSRLPDQAQSYTTMEFSLGAVGHDTRLTLLASDFPTPTILKHLQFYWAGTLSMLKRYAEQRGPRGAAAQAASDSSERTPGGVS